MVLLTYNGQFEGFNVKAEGYDFSYGNRHDSKYHMTITSSTPFSLNGVEYAGKAKYVHKDYYSDERSFFSFYAKIMRPINTLTKIRSISSPR